MEKINSVVKFGDTGEDVKLVQEWLCHHGFGTKPDGDFGKATKSALTQFLALKGLVTDVVTPNMFENILALPITVLEQYAAQDKSKERVTTAELMVELAIQNYMQHPTEIPGSNQGPWVRWYMDGMEAAWCAAFVSYLLKASCKMKGVEKPYKGSYSCDVLAANAKKAGRLKKYDKAKGNTPKPGDFMLFGDTSDFTHVGVIIQDNFDGTTINLEGNTAEKGKSKGTREGWMLGRMYRPLDGKYYIDNQGF